MKKPGTLTVEGVIAPDMATNDVRLPVVPIIPKEAWCRVDRERKWDNENREEPRRSWAFLRNAIIFWVSVGMTCLRS